MVFGALGGAMASNFTTGMVRKKKKKRTRKKRRRTRQSRDPLASYFNN